MSINKKGSCHCGAVKFDVSMDQDVQEALSCNCSICQRKGTLLSFYPRTQFKLHSGEQNLTDYLFNKKQIHHLFCKTCGVTSFAYANGPDGTPMVAVNVRCFDGIDIDKLKIQKYDGRRLN